MCLSDCQSCKYIDRTPNHRGDVICGVAPAYASMWERLHDLDEYTLNCVPIDECREFELNPELEEKEISLSLSFADWQTLIRESKHPAIIDALKDVLIQLNLSFTVKQWQAIANTKPILMSALVSKFRDSNPSAIPGLMSILLVLMPLLILKQLLS